MSYKTLFSYLTYFLLTYLMTPSTKFHFQLASCEHIHYMYFKSLKCGNQKDYFRLPFYKFNILSKLPTFVREKFNLFSRSHRRPRIGVLNGVLNGILANYQLKSKCKIQHIISQTKTKIPLEKHLGFAMYCETHCLLSSKRGRQIALFAHTLSMF